MSFSIGVFLSFALFPKSKNYTTRDNELILPPASSSLMEGFWFGLVAWGMDDDDEVVLWETSALGLLDVTEEYCKKFSWQIFACSRGWWW